MNIINKKFESKYCMMNTVMEELKLNHNIKDAIRTSLITTEPSFRSHTQMKHLFDHLPPSMIKKVSEF